MMRHPLTSILIVILTACAAGLAASLISTETPVKLVQAAPTSASRPTPAKAPDLWIGYLAVQADRRVRFQTSPFWPSLSVGSPAPEALWAPEVSDGTYLYRRYTGRCSGDGRARHCEGGLNIVKGADPAETVIGSYAAPQTVTGIAVEDGLAYVTWQTADLLFAQSDLNRAGGLQIVDVSNPARPVEISSYGTPWTNGVLLHDHYAYILTWRNLEIVDVTDPTHPVQAGVFQDSGFPTKALVAGNMLYVLWTDDCVAGTPQPPCRLSLRLLDISKPAQPLDTGLAYDLPGRLAGSNPETLAIIDNYLYVPVRTNEWVVFRISDLKRQNFSCLAEGDLSGLGD
jgi:hypothetical protein